MLADLHCHTTASDGSLSPIELLQRARQQGVELLSITDHDTMAGYFAARDHEGAVPQLVPGIELSCVWGKMSIHIVGLNVDPYNDILQQGIERQSIARVQRAQLIAARLEKYGFKGTYEGALQRAGNSQLGRPHFASFLVEEGYVRSVSEAFKKYLGAGKPGDIKALWPGMQEVIGWIVASGGIAVLAHPLHYKMTATRLRALLTDFKNQGGQALEVISGHQTPDKTRYLHSLGEQFGLASSCGSDFHRPGQAWCELGAVGALPRESRPVWDLWSA